MLKKTILVLISMVSLSVHSQRYRDYEVGPMLNFEYTSLYVASSVFGEKDGKNFSNSGHEPNYAAGLYGIYYFRPKMGLGAELYYQKTSSSALSGGDHYNSITFMPYVNFDPFRQIRNFYFGAGVGASFIQEAPDYGSTVQEKDIRVITMPVRLSTSYRIRNQFTFELGVQAELLEVVNDQVRRNSVYFGMKIPVNRVFGGYR